jgi:site-specific DNA recombinase
VRLDGYIRVSRVGGREGDSFISPDVQRERITAYAKARGHELVRVHEDLDQPGSKLDRPGFQAALARVERGETDGVIVAKLDRFARSLRGALESIERINAAGGQLVSVEDGFDSSTPMGRFARDLLIRLAELELDRIRENWDTAQCRAVARGVHVASRIPTGYARREDGRLEPDPQAASVIAELFRRRAAGAGWAALADFVNASGIRGPYDNAEWTTGSLAKVVANRVYLGEARSGQHVNPSAHEPLVSADEWAAAQSARNGVSIRNGEGLLLAGLVRCQGCRYLVKNDVMKDRDGSRLGFYRCRGRHPSGRCPAPIGILARVLDPYVEKQFLAALKPRGFLAEASRDTKAIDRASVQVQAAELELNSYRDTQAVSIVGRASFEAGLESRAQELDRARRELAEARERSALAETIALTPGDPLEVWPTLSIGEKRTLLSAAIDAVIVKKARGAGRSVPVEERAVILWRGQAPDDLPRRGRRVPLASFTWPVDGNVRATAGGRNVRLS